MTARIQIRSTGLVPAAVDPTRSYISDIKVFKDDMADALWGDLTTAPRFRRVLQIAFLDKVREILQAVNGSREEYLMAKMAFIQGGV